MHFRQSPLYRTEAVYVDHICSLVPITAREVKIFGTGFTTSIKNAVLNILKEGRLIKFIDTTRIHDRMVLRDGSEALWIGTSFGGFGNKIFAINALLPDDVKVLRRVLYDIERNP